MRGQILSYSPETGEGIISGQDGKRYTFRGTEYRGNVLAIRLGSEVDFDLREDGSAAGVIPLPGAGGAPSALSRFMPNRKSPPGCSPYFSAISASTNSISATPPKV